jgi:DnaK suppressor protein
MKIRELKSLRKRYDKLRDEIIATIKNSDFEVDVDGDVVDKLQGASLLRVQNQLSKINMNRLRTLDAAIEQIDAGEYGKCEECDEDIGIKRLEAMPGVTLCISCAEKAELQR